jgi:hypothetical protein
MIAFIEVAKIIAFGTRLRGSLVSSTVDYVSISIGSRTLLCILLMCKTPSKLLIGYATASMPMENATPGLSQPASVCKVMKTYLGVLRFASTG